MSNIMINITLPDGETVAGPLLITESTQWWTDAMVTRPGVTVTTIGNSRAGHPLTCVQVGHGQLQASITAGAHADEPAGPLAAAALIWYLSGTSDEARAFRDTWTLTIFPQVNPDGALANMPWFAPAPVIHPYIRLVRRELPGDDVEFAYPTDDKPALRPENEAIAQMLRQQVKDAGAPFQFHASLHSMGFARGAWILLGKEWVDRTTNLRRDLSELIRRSGYALHDIDRRGEKGFTRIEPGFCTTPSSAAMRQFFLDNGDELMAARFGRNSMEFVQSLGGDPLLLVTEIPNFSIGAGWTPGRPHPEPGYTEAPEPGSTLYEQSRQEFRGVMGGAPDGYGVKWHDAVQELAGRYDVVPVPFSQQASLMIRIVLRSLKAAEQV